MLYMGSFSGIFWQLTNVYFYIYTSLYSSYILYLISYKDNCNFFVAYRCVFPSGSD